MAGADQGLVSDVAVLYVDPRGPYPKLVEHWYDEERDAVGYNGPWPVVAHPPCGPWGRLRHLSRRPQDKNLALIALTDVRRWGGVLEHPAGSLLWRHADLPTPEDRADRFGGYTIEVEQCSWGHVARKKTWLYLCRVDCILMVRGLRTGGTPTHWISGGRGREGKKKTTPVPPGIKVCSEQQRRRTPPAFAEWLITLARSVDFRSAISGER